MQIQIRMLKWEPPLVKVRVSAKSDLVDLLSQSTEFKKVSESSRYVHFTMPGEVKDAEIKIKQLIKEKAPIKGANNSQSQYTTEAVTNQEWKDSRADRGGW